MKRITLNTAAITSLVALATKYTPSNGDFTGKIVLQGENGKLVVKATDNVETIILKDLTFISDDITEDSFEAISLDAKKLLTVLKAARTEDIIIEFGTEQITIKSGRSRVKIQTTNEIQDITIDSTDSHLDIDKNITDCFKQILHAVDNDNPKYELNGVLIQIKNNIMNIVGTDTRRLAIVNTIIQREDIDLIIPKSGIKTILNLFQGENITMELSDDIMAIHANSVSYSTRLINGKFPEWSRIVPANYASVITLPTTKLKNILQSASIFNNEISLTINNGTIEVKDLEGETIVEDTISDTTTQIHFNINAKSVSDILNSSLEDDITIGFNDSNLPITFMASVNYKEICMPIVVENDVNKINDDVAIAA